MQLSPMTLKLLGASLIIHAVYILETNNILSRQQAGFRKNYSSQTSLLNITNKWLVNMNKGYLNGVVFLDLKKADLTAWIIKYWLKNYYFMDVLTVH
jgi:hypothetical protein